MKCQVHELIPHPFSPENASALTQAERQQLIPVGQARKLVTDVCHPWFLSAHSSATISPPW